MRNPRQAAGNAHEAIQSNSRLWVIFLGEPLLGAFMAYIVFFDPEKSPIESRLLLDLTPLILHCHQ
jgi:hypothetical protein